MCVQYWPASNDLEETYGGIHLKVIQEEELANFRIRTFRLYKTNGSVRNTLYSYFSVLLKFTLKVVTEERFILQFHFTEWHCHSCPFGNALLEFRRRVRAVVGHRIKSKEAGPMVVHCKWVSVYYDYFQFLLFAYTHFFFEKSFGNE